MDLEIIKDALENSLSLLNKELESVTFDELKEEYIIAIQKIENAIIVLEKNG